MVTGRQMAGNLWTALSLVEILLRSSDAPLVTLSVCDHCTQNICSITKHNDHLLSPVPSEIIDLNYMNSEMYVNLFGLSLSIKELYGVFDKVNDYSGNYYGRLLQLCSLSILVFFFFIVIPTNHDTYNVNPASTEKFLHCFIFCLTI